MNPRPKTLRPPAALPTLGLLLAAILLLTWPWVPNFLVGTPAGSEPSTLTHFHLGLLEWARVAASTGASWWDPPFFAPFSGVNAWSEPQPLLAALSLLTSPFLPSIPTYNLLILGYLLLIGWAGTAIATELGADRSSARLVGIWLAAGPQIAEQLGAPHLVAQGFPYLCLLGLLRLYRDPAPRWLWLGATGGLLTGLSGSQNFVFLLLVLPVFVGVLLLSGGRGWRARIQAPLRLALHGLGAVSLGALALAPFFLPQLERLRRMGNHRELGEVLGVFQLRELITPADGHWLGSGFFGLTYAAGWYSWDMGVVLVLVGMLGLLLYRHRPGAAGLALGALSLWGLLLGFGPSASITVGDVTLCPYALLFKYVPGLDGLRSPAHIAPFPALGFAVFGGLGLSQLRSRWPALPWLPLVGVLVLAEMWSLPARIAVPAPETEEGLAALHFIRGLPDDAAGVELPMSTGDAPADYTGEVVALRRALVHGQPVANGYSGYFPTAYFQLRTAYRTDPTGLALRYAEALGLGWLWVHPSAAGLSTALSGLIGPPAWKEGGEAIFRLPAHPPRLGTLPAEAKLRQAPSAHDFIGLRLPGPLRETSLFYLSEPRQIPVTIRPVDGQSFTRELLLSGSALVDRGQSRIWVLIQSPPTADQPGRGRLAAVEELPAGSR